MAGLTKSRLERMRTVLSGYVERKDLPGLVALVSHHDDVHVEALGAISFTKTASGAQPPIKTDTIFRIASLTKPIAAVAAMILVEKCKLRLDGSTPGCRNSRIAAFSNPFPPSSMTPSRPCALLPFATS